jgi:hypothetical protein
MPETYVDEKGVRRIKGTGQLFSKWAAENLRVSHKDAGAPRGKGDDQTAKKKHWENPEDRSF